MKNKIICIAFILIILASTIFAQETVQHLKNGLTVAVLSRTVPPVSEPKWLGPRSLGLVPETAIDKDNETKVLRSIFDFRNRISYDYGMEIIQQNETDKFKIKFSAEPYISVSVLDKIIAEKESELQKAQNKEKREQLEKEVSMIKDARDEFLKNIKRKPLPKYPDGILVSDGDTIVLDILEDPKTGAKVQDLIRITRENKEKGYFVDLEEARDFTINDIQFNLVDYQIFINGEMVIPLRKDSSLSASASNLMLVIPKGLFFLSPIPRENYKLEKIGTIEDNKILFTYDGNKYKIVSKAPILAKTGKWNLWGGFKPTTGDNLNQSFPGGLRAFLLTSDSLDLVLRSNFRFFK